MKIKWAEEFKSNKRIEDVERNSLFKRLLGRECVGNYVQKYKMSDLYCGELSCVLGKDVYKVIEDSTSDILFDLQPMHIGIFTYQQPKFYKYMFVDGDYYIHVARGKKFVSDKYQSNIKIKQWDIVVNSETATKLIDRYWKDVVESGYNEDSVLTMRQIEQFEKYLNEKYKDFLHGLRFVR